MRSTPPCCSVWVMTTSAAVEPATFVAVPDGTEAYWEGWATPCGSETIDGKAYRIVATKRLGDQGRSDGQFIVDRLASGLHFGRILERS